MLFWPRDISRLSTGLVLDTIGFISSIHKLLIDYKVKNFLVTNTFFVAKNVLIAVL